MTQSPRKSKGALRRWTERVLLLAGIAGVGFFAASQIAPVIWQDWAGWVLDRQVSGQDSGGWAYLKEKEDRLTHGIGAWLGLTPPEPEKPAANSPPRGRGPSLSKTPAIGPDGLIGRLSIPRLRLTAIVREGTGEKTLSLAAGHIPGTSLPGVNGNVAVAGHRDTLFRGLRGIQMGDVIQFEALNGSFEYRVDSTEIVTPKDVGVLQSGQQPELTLVTCYPFDFIGSAPKRFIVKATQVSKAKTEPEVWQEVSRQNEDTRKTAPRRTNFNLALHHPREVAPGVSMGITDVDPIEGSFYGWMRLTPDDRTVWLRDQLTDDPFVFYSGRNGARRELTITKVTSNSVSGYLALAQ